MADAAEIIRRVLDDSGHWELVEDYAAGNLADRGVMRHLNAGQRFLDRYVQRPDVAHRQILSVPAGQYAVAATGMQRVESVEVEDGDGALTPLRRMDLLEARALYGTPFTSVTPAPPVHWVRSPERIDMVTYTQPATTGWHVVDVFDVEMVGETAVGRITLAPLTANTTGKFWHLMPSVTWIPEYDYSGEEWSGLGGAISAVADYIRKSVLFYVFPGEAQGRSIAISASGSEGLEPRAATLTVADIAHPSGGFYLQPLIELLAGDDWTSVPIGETVSSETPACDTLAFIPTTDFVYGTEPLSLTISEFSDNTEYPEEEEEDVDSEQLGDIAILPPPDSAVTVRLFGDQFAKDFASLTDMTWWSAMEPDLLVRAVRGSIEGHLHRNTQGARDFLAPIIEELKQIYFQRCAEEMAGLADDGRISP